MKELLRTTDAVFLSFARAVLADAGIEAFLLDNHMSVMEGSLLILPCRLMVTDENLEAARKALAEAGHAQA